MVTISDYLAFFQSISEYIIKFDTFLHKKIDKFFAAMPGENKELSGFIFLCLADMAIAKLDMSVDWTIDLRPIFVLPIIFAAIYLSRGYAYAIASLSALLHAESFRVSIIPKDQTIPLLQNFLPALCIYIAVAEFGSLATGTIRELLAYIDVLHEELALERIAGMNLRGAEDGEGESKGDGESEGDVV